MHFVAKAIFKIVKDPNTRWTLKKKFPEFFFDPHMKPDEYALFKETCNNKKRFLEYGSGGSTIHLLKNKKDVFSVESNRDFYGYMSSISLVKKSLGKELHYKFVDFGETTKWGEPLSGNSDNWSRYYKEIWNEIDPAKDKVDVIFIDGRFRVCCCLYSISKALEYNWKNTIFMIHDFWRREQYQVVLKFLKEIKSSRSLAAFTIKDNINIDELNEMLQEYALVTK
jgi:protein O-GlcNAc transferase